MVEEREGKKSKGKEEKIKICLVEEGKGKKEEELILPVWEYKRSKGEESFQYTEKGDNEGGGKAERN